MQILFSQSMDALANLYSELLHAACLEQRRTTLGEIHPATLSSMNNSSGLLYYSQGQHGKAELLYVVACLQQRCIVLSENHPDTLTSMSYLAALYKNKRQYENAEPLYVTCLEQRRVALGDSHPETLISMNALTVTYANLDKYEIAEPLHAACLEQRRIALGERHPHAHFNVDEQSSCFLLKSRSV